MAELSQATSEGLAALRYRISEGRARTAEKFEQAGLALDKGHTLPHHILAAAHAAAPVKFNVADAGPGYAHSPAKALDAEKVLG